MDIVSIALRTIGLVCELWPELVGFLDKVTSHPDFAGQSIALQVRTILPEVSESEKAADTLREAGHI